MGGFTDEDMEDMYCDYCREQSVEKRCKCCNEILDSEWEDDVCIDCLHSIGD